ncbi:MAG: hypothetical protein LBF88_14235 [Planctomycetaceae bacterium]|jgi:ADP-ribosylglycohydrolase|nr:hypothetical protein [Planctomycetaceae bacterium]
MKFTRSFCTLSFYSVFFIHIFVIVLALNTNSFVIADDDPFEALRGLNLKLKDEKKDDDKKDETNSNSASSQPKTEQDKKTEKLVVTKVRPAMDKIEKSDTKTTDRVEAATWLLLTGEYLFKDATESTLWSDTITSLHKGTEQLNLLEFT